MPSVLGCASRCASGPSGADDGRAGGDYSRIPAAGWPPCLALGLDPAWRRAGELAAGFLGGGVLIGVVAVGTWAVLPFPWAFNPAFSLPLAAFSLVPLLCGNAAEELIFRGYSFERLIAGVGVWKAKGLTALLFAAFHVVNGWPWLVALIGTTTGSLLFGLVFIRWRSVPAASGVHAAMNWTRDLLLLDPPTSRTLFAPLAPRPWSSGEQIGAVSVALGIVLLVCASLWQSMRRGASPDPDPARWA